MALDEKNKELIKNEFEKKGFKVKFTDNYVIIKKGDKVIQKIKTEDIEKFIS